jgi:hypothetical protein
MLVCYSTLQLLSAATRASAAVTAAGADAQLQQMLAPVEDLTRLVYVTVYASLIAIALVVQGGTALYYVTRRRHVVDYVNATPPWIAAMQRAGLWL